MSQENNGFRLAGTRLGLDLTEGMSDASLNDLRRVRSDKLFADQMKIGGSIQELKHRYPQAPENSQPGYAISGAYQPSFTYGA